MTGAAAPAGAVSTVHRVSTVPPSSSSRDAPAVYRAFLDALNAKDLDVAGRHVDIARCR